MTADATRSGPEIRARLAERLNDAVRRPGLYVHELVLMLIVDDLAWIDRREDELGSAGGWLDAMGAWSSTAGRGAFVRMFGGHVRDHDAAVGMVYADLAHRRGYLAAEPVLTGEQYGRLRREARPWTEGADRVVADLVAEFGTPSLWRPRYNPRFPVSVGYVSARPSDPLIAFDFWPDRSRDEGRSPAGSEPVLRNVRWMDEGKFGCPFRTGFTFTPTGRTLLVPPADEDYEE